MKRAVFLDRDGTIARDVPYCRRVEDFQIIPGAAEAAGVLSKHGFLIVVVTNQSGLARGYVDLETLDAIHDYMRREIRRRGGRIDAVYYCPHHPDEGCACRKPRPGMLLEASRDWNINLQRSFLVGDQEGDILAAHAAGCKAVLLQDGSPEDRTDRVGSLADHHALSLLEAAKWIARDG